MLINRPTTVFNCLRQHLRTQTMLVPPFSKFDTMPWAHPSTENHSLSSIWVSTSKDFIDLAWIWSFFMRSQLLHFIVFERVVVFCCVLLCSACSVSGRKFQVEYPRNTFFLFSGKWSKFYAMPWSQWKLFEMHLISKASSWNWPNLKSIR